LTVHRKILKVKTEGSRISGDLRPKLCAALPRGVNLVVLEYTDNDAACVVEIYGSDHTDLAPEERVDKERLESVARHESVLSHLSSHPQSPKVIGRYEKNRVSFEEG
jgi:hypothetical protein